MKRKRPPLDSWKQTLKSRCVVYRHQHAVYDPLPQAIHVERKELQAQWNSALAALSKRNDALAILQNAAREQRQLLFAKQTEIEATKKQVLTVQVRRWNSGHCIVLYCIV